MVASWPDRSEKMSAKFREHSPARRYEIDNGGRAIRCAWRRETKFYLLFANERKEGNPNLYLTKAMRRVEFLSLVFGVTFCGFDFFIRYTGSFLFLIFLLIILMCN